MPKSSGGESKVIVVGAGPAGSAVAAYLAGAGIETLVLEKAAFPRAKACGDGLTPRAVKELIHLGLTFDEADGWRRNRGLRVFGGGHELELPWPALASFPDFGLTMPRERFDQAMARHAVGQGAALRENVTVTAPILDDRNGRVVGVKAVTDEGEQDFLAPLVVAADGASARLATAIGRQKNTNRPVGVAVRTRIRLPEAYCRQARPGQLDWMESHLELWDGPPGQGRLMPGYGWVFPEAAPTPRPAPPAAKPGAPAQGPEPEPALMVNVGVGSVTSRSNSAANPNTSPNTNTGSAKVNYRQLLTKWLDTLGPRWGFDSSDIEDPPRSAALPMAFNRQPLYARGLLLVGDAGGMVSPFDGEGIAYAMQSGRVAAGVIAQALARPAGESREAALRTYSESMKESLGGYFSLGRVFVKLIEHPAVMRVCTRYGLPRPVLMKLVMKLLSDLYEPRGGDWMDRTIAALARMAPAA
ncbi:MAG: FAD-dependent monooxygenase [Bifidobacteriaceae bacterium]|nr:FAD-dependent monooxygenase [Bifidobacteriaceae bacterium]